MSDYKFMKLLKDKKVADAYQYFEASAYKLYLAELSYSALETVIAQYQENEKTYVEKVYEDALTTGKGAYKAHTNCIEYFGTQVSPTVMRCSSRQASRQGKRHTETRRTDTGKSLKKYCGGLSGLLTEWQEKMCCAREKCLRNLRQWRNSRQKGLQGYRLMFGSRRQRRGCGQAAPNVRTAGWQTGCPGRSVS